MGFDTKSIRPCLFQGECPQKAVIAIATGGQANSSPSSSADHNNVIPGFSSDKDADGGARTRDRMIPLRSQGRFAIQSIVNAHLFQNNE
ncbi:hypothetical protein PoB_006386500 [Plakobranchus ocellatus]|uniref:Uncharacterized protein n=1 Tax=Plakobranchus ocellatus TaxID=259542 RepID=A0AAV4CZQ2_9GAST|nr:hypothetical protein PoB_006386500 [Plakobranchus ocellatus]